MCGRQVTWMRQRQALPIATHGDTNTKVVSIGETWERVVARPQYDDGGPWVVVETVPGLEWRVVHLGGPGSSYVVKLALGEACELAAELNAAEARAG